MINVADDVLDTMVPFVRDMHASSGLTDAVRASTVTLGEAEKQVLDYVAAHVPDARSRAAVRQLDRHRPRLPRPRHARPGRSTCTTG